MLTYTLDKDGAPLYERLYRHIRDDILNGVLRAGERLPSRRALAEHLRVSVTTVETAYRQLEAEGYVTVSARRGAFVSETDRPPVRAARGNVSDVRAHGNTPDTSAHGNTPDTSARGNVSDTNARGNVSDVRAHGNTPDTNARGNVPDANAARQDRLSGSAADDAEPDSRVWRLDLGSNRPDTACFPAAALARLTRQALSDDLEALFRPSPSQGLPQLRAAIADDLRAYRGMSVSAEQIIVGAGAEYLYLLLAQLLGRTALFALEDPGYLKIRQVYRHCGASYACLPLDEHGLRVDALRRSGATVAHISPAHHYPTGIVMPIGRRHALLRWAEERGGFLIEDDYDSELRFSGRPIPTLQSIDHSGRVIYLNTFSQTISPSLRVGYLILPPVLLETYRRELYFYACTVPTLEQNVLARFLSGGQYEQHLSRLRKTYRARRAAVLDAFRHSPFARRVAISERGAGLHFLLRLDTSVSDETLKARAEAYGVRLRFLSDYAAAPGPSFAHTLVVNYAGLNPDKLPETVELLSEVFKEL